MSASHDFWRLYGDVRYWAVIWALFPLNVLLCHLRRGVTHGNSVLHISGFAHTAYETTRALRKAGVKADYLAIGSEGRVWRKCDFQFVPCESPSRRALSEFLFFWRVMARYEIVHCHFMMTLSKSGWELKFLRRMGRKIIVHFRGCEIRDRETIMARHPETNICQECDYNAKACRGDSARRRRRLAHIYGDYILVTTPDLKEFAPRAEVIPFFTPDIDYESYKPMTRSAETDGEFRVVHVTVHPGLEGTKSIETAIRRLRDKGYTVRLVSLQWADRETVLREMAQADVLVGKMKMGHYANAQIESMFLGTPAVTHVWPEFMTDRLRDSGFIFTTLAELEETLERYIVNPGLLEEKRKIARKSILKLHDNGAISRRLADLYEEVKTGVVAPV